MGLNYALRRISSAEICRWLYVEAFLAKADVVRGSRDFSSVISIFVLSATAGSSVRNGQAKW